LCYLKLVLVGTFVSVINLKMKAMFRNVWILFVMLFALATVNGNTRLHLDVDQYKQLEFLSTPNTSIQLPEISSNSHHIALFSGMLEAWECSDAQELKEVDQLLYFTIIPIWLSAMGVRYDKKQDFSFPTEHIGVILNPRYILFKCIKIPI
jgi:hypothetical protein